MMELGLPILGLTINWWWRGGERDCILVAHRKGDADTFWWLTGEEMLIQ
jgi:hypothetical protein